RVRFPNPRARSNGDNECTKMIVMAATGNGNSSDQERKMLIFKVRDSGSQDTQLQPQQM
ncbi:Rna-Binding Protein 27, partial [Manis pentadactyla]